MTDEIDEETLRIVKGYFGRDPRIPRNVSVTAFSTGTDEWSALDFLNEITSAVNAIRDECRATAVVELEGGYDESTSLTVRYSRLQTPEEVAADVARGLAYAEGKAAEDRAAYERLKAKFGQ